MVRLHRLRTFQMHDADPEEVFGYRLDWMLPKPVPFDYRFMPSDERAGRGRAALRLWLLGFPARTAWGFALSSGLDWREHLPDDYRGRRRVTPLGVCNRGSHPRFAPHPSTADAALHPAVSGHPAETAS